MTCEPATGADAPQEPSEPGADAPGAHDWAAYYRYTLGREPRPLFTRGLAAATASGVAPGTALDVGSGDGTEALALLAAGWRVVAVDSAPQSAEVIEPRVPPGQRDRLTLVTAPAEEVDLPPLDLVYSAYVLSYLPPAGFTRLWENVRARLNPGGLIVVNIFGDRHGWAGEPGATYLSRREVEACLDGLEVLALEELEEDGTSFAGPTHWHVWDVVARRPA